MTNLVLLSVFLSTNFIYGPISTNDMRLIQGDGSDGGVWKWVERGDIPMVKTNYVFGIIDGTNRIELLTVQKERK